MTPQMVKPSPLQKHSKQLTPLDSSTPTEKKDRYSQKKSPQFNNHHDKKERFTKNNKVNGTTSSSDEKEDKLPFNKHAGNRNAKQIKKTFVRNPLPADVNDGIHPVVN
jgi:hypothetical protein